MNVSDHSHPDHLAAVFAASYGRNWEDLPEDSIFGLSKNKLRERAARTEAAAQERQKYPSTDPRAWKM